jgi:DNA-binding LacI/PurR family transcriptional regulator
VARVTLQTIADSVGVSRMTVSNAFSRPDQLSDELRTRILETATSLGYAGPDPTARGLAKGTTGTVGILLTDSLVHAFEDEIAARFVGAIAGELAPTGLALTLLTSTDQGERIPARDVPLDAALVYSCDQRSGAVEWLLRRGLPLVFVDQRPRPGYDSVNIDDHEGARLAAQHVVSLGHRRIGLITGSLDGPVGLLGDRSATSGNPVGHDRVSGWLAGLEGADAQVEIVQAGEFGEPAGRFGAELLLDLDEPPTAIICISDLAAYGVVQVAAERGLAVPGDLSVVGFDGTHLAARMNPALTTVRQDVEAKGREAARALVRSLEVGGRRDRARRTILPVELVVGESTGAPSSTTA